MSHSCLSSLSKASTIKHIFHHHSSASFSTLTSDFSLISCINMLPFCTRKILLLLQKLSMQSAVQQEACTALCAREKVEAAHETCRGVRSAGCGPEQPAAPPPCTGSFHWTAASAASVHSLVHTPLSKQLFHFCVNRSGKINRRRGDNNAWQLFTVDVCTKKRLLT